MSFWSVFSSWMSVFSSFSLLARISLSGFLLLLSYFLAWFHFTFHWFHWSSPFLVLFCCARPVFMTHLVQSSFCTVVTVFPFVLFKSIFQGHAQFYSPFLQILTSLHSHFASDMNYCHISFIRSVSHLEWAIYPLLFCNIVWNFMILYKAYH